MHEQEHIALFFYFSPLCAVAIVVNGGYLFSQNVEATLKKKMYTTVHSTMGPFG